jgi:hypothetical protein
MATSGSPKASFAELGAIAFAAHRALWPMGETDLFFHLKIGDLIRAEHRIPFQNLFSFTHPNQPDPDLAWGFQVLVSWLYQLGGFPAIVLLKVACVMAATALVGRACRKSGFSPPACALAMVLAVLAAEQRIVERPHLLTFVGIGVLLNLLVEKRTWALPLLALVWANFHAGVFFAPLVATLWLVGARLDGEQVSRRDWLYVAGAALATFCTPAGTRLPSYLLWHTGLGATRIIEEFRHADPWDDPWFFTLLTLSAITLLRLGRGAGFRRVLPVAIVALLAWRSVRFAAEFGFVAAPLAACGLDAVAKLLAERTRKLQSVLIAIALVATIALERRGEAFSLALAPDVVPFDAIDFVTKNGLRDRMYEDLDVGCYLLWEGWPKWRVFQDARLPAYPDAFHRSLDETPLEPAAFDALLSRWNVDAALIDYPDVNMRSGSFDPEKWALVYRAEDALVFARRTPEHAALIAAREIPLRIRFKFAGGSWIEPLHAPPPGSTIPPDEWRKRLLDALRSEL